MVVQPQDFQARKDDQDHQSSDKAVLFNSVKTPIEVGKWYGMVLELQGQELVAHLLGAANEPTAQMKVSLGKQQALAGPKANIGLKVSGAGASFRNLRVSRVVQNPSWASLKSALEQAVKP